VASQETANSAVETAAVDGVVVEALPSRVAVVAVAAADVVDIAKVSAVAKDDSSEQQQPERIALTCGEVVVAAAVAAVVVAADAKTADQYVEAPFLLLPCFSLFEAAVVPTSPEQDSLRAIAAAAAQTDRCLPVAPT